MIKTKVAFLKGRLFFSQSGLFENFSDCFDWMDESRPFKKATLFWSWSCKLANYVRDCSKLAVRFGDIADRHRYLRRLKVVANYDKLQLW